MGALAFVEDRLTEASSSKFGEQVRRQARFERILADAESDRWGGSRAPRKVCVWRTLVMQGLLTHRREAFETRRQVVGSSVAITARVMHTPEERPRRETGGTAAPYTVGAYMTPSPHTVGAEQPLRVARELMRLNHVRHLPVLHGGRLVGILSEREVRSLEVLPGSGFLTVEEAMVPEVYVTPVGASLDAVAAEMAGRRLGSAVVIDGTSVVGVFTVIDALRALADALTSSAAGA